jgi:hypothetical protein
MATARDCELTSVSFLLVTQTDHAIEVSPVTAVLRLTGIWTGPEYGGARADLRLRFGGTASSWACLPRPEEQERRVSPSSCRQVSSGPTASSFRRSRSHPLTSPPGSQISQANNMLTAEYGTASNIKSRVNR